MASTRALQRVGLFWGVLDQICEVSLLSNTSALKKRVPSTRAEQRVGGQLQGEGEAGRSINASFDTNC